NLVGVLRTRYASHVGESAFEELLEELRTKSPWFDRTWRSFLTAPLEYTSAFQLTAPGLGLLRSRPVRFLLPHNPDYALFSLVAADTGTSEILERASRDLPSIRRPPPPT